MKPVCPANTDSPELSGTRQLLPATIRNHWAQGPSHETLHQPGDDPE